MEHETLEAYLTDENSDIRNLAKQILKKRTKFDSETLKKIISVIEIIKLTLEWKAEIEDNHDGLSRFQQDHFTRINKIFEIQSKYLEDILGEKVDYPTLKEK